MVTKPAWCAVRLVAKQQTQVARLRQKRLHKGRVEVDGQQAERTDRTAVADNRGGEQGIENALIDRSLAAVAAHGQDRLYP